MLHIDVRSNNDKVIQNMVRMAKKDFPSSLGRAIDSTAIAVEKEIHKHTKAKVKNPVPFTGGKNSTFVKQTQSRQKIKKAVVGMKDIQASYMVYMEEGGTSRPLGGGDNKPVPATKSENKYGNLPKRGKIAKLLANKVQFFSGKPKGKKNRPAGIYKRLGAYKARERITKGKTGSVYSSKQLELVATWKTSTQHNKITRYDERVRLIVQRMFARELVKELKAKGVVK